MPTIRWTSRLASIRVLVYYRKPQLWTQLCSRVLVTLYVGYQALEHTIAHIGFRNYINHLLDIILVVPLSCFVVNFHYFHAIFIFFWVFFCFEVYKIHIT
jgi:hypothetical protein